MTRRFPASGAELPREVVHSVLLLLLTGSSVGGVLGMLAIATRALGR